VRYLGAWTRDEVQQRLGRYSVLAVPSEGEAHSLVTLEALAAGVPVVVTPEAAGDLKTGSIGVTIAELGPAFAEALRESMRSSQDPAFRRELAAYAERELSWVSIAERYERAVAAIADS
jgi:glycosyltransferase involved in cell wall biosynthesis